MRIPGNKTVLLLLAAQAAVVIAGCGGGGDETTDTAATTTEEPRRLAKAELIEEGDGICAEVNAAVGALGGEVDEAAVPETIEKTSNLYLGMVERLQELGTPAGDDGDYSEFMEAAEELAKVEGEVKLAAEREDTEALGAAATAAAPALEEFQSAAEDFGFEDCSKGPGEATTTGPAGAEAGAAPSGEELAPELEEEGGVEAEPEYVEPELEEAPAEEVAPETGGAGGGAEAAPEAAPESGGSESGGVGPG